MSLQPLLFESCSICGAGFENGNKFHNRRRDFSLNFKTASTVVDLEGNSTTVESKISASSQRSRLLGETRAIVN